VPSAVSQSFSIHQRLVRAFTAFGMLPVLAFGTVMALADYHVRLGHGADVVEAVGRASAAQLSMFLDLHTGAVHQLADRLADHGPDAYPPPDAELLEALARTRGSFPGFLTMLATDAEGVLVAGFPTRLSDGQSYRWTGIDVRDRAYFRVPRVTGKPYLSGVFVGRGFGNDLLAAVSAPMVTRDGTMLGVVQGAIRLEGLDELLRAAAAQPGVELMVVDPARRVAFATSGAPLAPMDAIADDRWIHRDTSDVARFVPERLDSAPIGDTLAYEHDTTQGWHVVAMVSRWHLLERTLTDVGLVLIMLVMTFSAAHIAGRIQSARVVEPLRELGRRLDSLSLVEVPAVPAERSHAHELATVEDAFARMAGRMAAAWQRLQDDIATEAMLRDELARSIAVRRTLDAELGIAGEIQRAMVPATAVLREGVGGVEFAALLEPARAVGGDFYNVIALDARYSCFYVGDVSDKGVAAALFMVRVATLLEIAARGGDPPGEVLSQVARQIARDNPSDMFATVLCGVFDSRTGAVSLASAGHEAPVLLAFDGRIERPLVETGPALGFDPDSHYPVSHLRLRSGDTLACFTDGLTEAPDAHGHALGDEGIDAALAGGQSLPPAVLIARLADATRAGAQAAGPHDDLTLLLLRRGAEVQPAAVTPGTLPLEMPNRLAVLPVLTAALDHALAEEGVPESLRHDVTLVTEEVLSNVVRHGYADGERDTIRVLARCEDGRLHLAFEDGGQPFNPLEHEMPDLDLPLDEREIGGLGVLLVRELSESIHYERAAGRNRLSLVIRLDATEEAHAP
jgi:serine phosphatase RsbU (regulator of sigma subunit)/anti-sigma regulatory factor (Ser/Thr protein kinase)